MLPCQVEPEEIAHYATGLHQMACRPHLSERPEEYKLMLDGYSYPRPQNAIRLRVSLTLARFSDVEYRCQFVQMLLPPRVITADVFGHVEVLIEPNE